jgi:hypothetical protein
MGILITHDEKRRMVHYNRQTPLYIKSGGPSGIILLYLDSYFI